MVLVISTKYWEYKTEIGLLFKFSKLIRKLSVLIIRVIWKIRKNKLFLERQEKCRLCGIQSSYIPHIFLQEKLADLNNSNGPFMENK